MDNFHPQLDPIFFLFCFLLRRLCSKRSGVVWSVVHSLSSFVIIPIPDNAGIYAAAVAVYSLLCVVREMQYAFL